MANPILSRRYRGDMLESVHRGSWIVLEEERELDAGGAVDRPVYPRSSLKPLQLLPLFASEDFDGLGLDGEERAILVASHSADEDHVARVRSAQAKGRIPEEALACGPHPPLDAEAAARLWARGGEPEPVHNNCSGKHTGFLLRARGLDASLEGYLDPEHPVQREVCAALSELAGIAEVDLVPGIDGCGAPNWPLPLRALAALFRDLANPDRLAERWRPGARRIFDAVQGAPHFVAGRGRFDTALLRAGRGSLLGKCGAEGCFAVGVRAGPRRPAMGIAMKVDDGAARGYQHAILGLLVDLGLLEGTEEDLAAFYSGVIENTQGRAVGRTTSRWQE